MGAGKPEDIIARQAEEIERLRERVESEQAIHDLRRALTLAAAAGTIGAPVTHDRLLEMILDTAAHVISARSGALFLLDEETHELVFEAALGSKADAVMKFRVPLGHGIAGLVAVSGQPIAISDAESDPHFAADIADRVGYIPKSVLCMPLFYGGRVIGVIELLDKEGATSFGPYDMEALTLFANQAAVALQQSRTHHNLAELIRDVLDIGDTQQTTRLAVVVKEHPTFRSSLELAQLVHEIVSEGDDETEACRAMLRGFAQYLRLRPGAGDLGPR
jgi:signal transduction protein with GAF and PtsI domain